MYMSDYKNKLWIELSELIGPSNLDVCHKKIYTLKIQLVCMQDKYYFSLATPHRLHLICKSTQVYSLVEFHTV